MTKDCKEIIKEYLIANKFDGLVNLDGECGCKLDDLNDCDSNIAECKPSYLWKNACKECTHHCDGYDVDSGNAYCMRLEKQPNEHLCTGCCGYFTSCVAKEGEDFSFIEDSEGKMVYECKKYEPLPF